MKLWAEMTERERNALVAEKVMGTPEPTESDIYDMNGALRGMWMLHLHKPIDEFPGWRLACKIEDRLMTPYWIPVPFLTDPRATMEVVEHMREQGFYLVVEDDTLWYVRFRLGDHDDVEWSASSSFGEAVCLAALRSVGVEI